MPALINDSTIMEAMFEGVVRLGSLLHYLLQYPKSPLLGHIMRPKQKHNLAKKEQGEKKNLLFRDK